MTGGQDVGVAARLNAFTAFDGNAWPRSGEKASKSEAGVNLMTSNDHTSAAKSMTAETAMPVVLMVMLMRACP